MPKITICFILRTRLVFFTESLQKTQTKMNDQSVPITSISLSVVIFCVYFPLMGYGIWRLWEHRRNVLIGKRYPSLTFCACFGLVLHCTALLFQIYSTEGVLLPVSNYIAELRFIAVGIFYVAFLLRFWMLFYNINWIMQTQNQNWKQIVNSEYKDPAISHQWFIANKKTYGNWYYTRRIGFIVAIVYCTAVHVNYTFTYVSQCIFILFANKLF